MGTLQHNVEIMNKENWLKIKKSGQLNIEMLFEFWEKNKINKIGCLFLNWIITFFHHDNGKG